MNSLPFWKILLVAFALGCDAFSVGVGVGTRGFSFRPAFRLSFHFGLFQFFMPILGILLGHEISQHIGHIGPWVAGGCLIIIGGKMLKDIVHHGQSETNLRKDPTRGWMLITLSVATSLDALLVGFGLGILHAGILFTCVVIGVTATVMTAAGLLLGAGIARGIGRWAEAFGGVILIVLGIWFIIW
jgi:putative Mn2+ efflux pump MntP